MDGKDLEPYMVVVLNRGAPIYTPKYCSPYYGGPLKVTHNLGTSRIPSTLERTVCVWILFVQGLDRREVQGPHQKLDSWDHIGIMENGNYRNYRSYIGGM